MANLRELATLHRPEVFPDRGIPGQPEIRRNIWCRINRGIGNRRRPNLYGYLPVGRPCRRILSDWRRKHGKAQTWNVLFDSDSFDIQNIRPFEGNPRQYAELRVSKRSGELPFTG